MDLHTSYNYAEPMDEMCPSTHTTMYHPYHQTFASSRCCVICGSKSVGMNFGVVTCAPCKAFFRRNARRKELLELPCRHRDLSVLLIKDIEFNERTARYLQIRRCSSCRLRRCFDMGMREELVRTEEENERHRQLVDINRKRRDLLKQQLLEIQQISFSPFVINNKNSSEIDWCHISNIVYAYDTCCLKTFTQQRAEMVFSQSSKTFDEESLERSPRALTMCLVLSISAFLKSLPAFYSLPRSTRNHLCKTNIRPLIFPNIHELNQSCYSEPWQIAAYASTWQRVCGSELYKDFIEVERVAEKFLITDPIVVRLWVVILFFSSPLHYHEEGPTLTPILKKKQLVRQTQNAYVTLLWKYLLHRYGDYEAVRIFSNLMRVYIKMQTVGFGVYTQLRTKKELLTTNETLNRLVTVDIHEDLKRANESKTF